MTGNTLRKRGNWASVLAAGILLAGCTAQGADGKPAPGSSSPSAAVPTGAGATAAPSASSTAAASVFTPNASLVPRTTRAGRALADAVVLAPADWGRGYVARKPAAGTPGTWAVLGANCRWEREKLPKGVLANSSRYSELPAGGGKSAVTVTAVATVHTSALGADEQLSTTLEEVLRCPRQQPRSNELITGMNSQGTPFGARGNNYADNSVLELGQFTVNGGAAQPYRWMVARLGTVVVAVSVTAGTGYTEDDLTTLGGNSLAKMLERIQQRLKGK